MKSCCSRIVNSWPKTLRRHDFIEDAFVHILRNFQNNLPSKTLRNYLWMEFFHTVKSNISKHPGSIWSYMQKMNLPTRSPHSRTDFTENYFMAASADVFIYVQLFLSFNYLIQCYQVICFKRET